MSDVGRRNTEPFASYARLATAPASATSATLYFHFAGAAATNLSATIDVDDVSLSSVEGSWEVALRVDLNSLTITRSIEQWIDLNTHTLIPPPKP